MNNLLYIKASPRGADSKSSALADAYLAALREQLPDLSVDTLDLSRESIPEFDGDKVAAKMAVIAGQTNHGRQRSAWDEIVEVAIRFIAADRYLIASPMWNGGIPYRLKQYIDVIHQPGLLWGLDPQTGYYGLLKNKKAVLALTSGAYGPSMPSPAFGIDHHSTYLRDWLNQAGVTEIEEIRFQPTLLTANPEGSFKAAIGTARSLAARG
ncbi:MAG TPA: NAD(P)H-dependent oxidoreductase [Bradyrhizobium sp.]|nr:NAD(P)H-dependent oxidoreductase [Bradyrhizobium sp.]